MLNFYYNVFVLKIQEFGRKGVASQLSFGKLLYSVLPCQIPKYATITLGHRHR